VGGVGDHRFGGIDPAEPLGLKSVVQQSVCEDQPCVARDGDAGRDVAGTVVARDNRLGSFSGLENGDAPVHAGYMREVWSNS